MEEPPPITVDLPPGFRFHPTDEEILTYYLTQKIIDSTFNATAIGEADLNKCEPWDLPQKAKMGEKEWYFFCQRDRKYPTGMRTNRATQTGYWKATGKDKEIFKGKTVLAGMKKTLVFYKGRAPRGEKTNWVMHEFRLEPKFSHLLHLPKSAKDEWVVCRVFHKNTAMTAMTGTKRIQTPDFFSSLPPLIDSVTAHIPISGGFDDGEVKWMPQGPSDDHYMKYISIGANDQQPQQHQQEAKLPLQETSGTAAMISTINSYLQLGPDDGFFSFDQLAAGGTTAMTTKAAMECKMEQLSWSMSGEMQDMSSSIDNGSYDAAAMVDLDLWDCYEN